MNTHCIKEVIANSLVILREEFDERAILFDPETGNTFMLNPIGVLIWKHLDGHHSLDDLVIMVNEKAEGVPCEVTSHIADFLRTAVNLGLASYDVK